MGIIKRQGIKYSIVGYTATAIGALSTIFIYPLDKSIYGYALFLVGTATFFYPFMSGGVASLVIRFFPEMKTEDNQNHGFLGFTQIVSIIAFLLFGSIGLLFKDSLYQGMLWLDMDADLIFDNIMIILVLTFLITQISILTPYTSNYQRIVVPNILTNLLFKIILPILILLYFYGSINEVIFGWGVVGYHLLGFLSLAVYLYFIGGLDWIVNVKAYTRERIKRMLTYTIYGILGSIGNILAFRIDLFMVPTMLGLFSTGIYGISQFIGASVELPTKALFQISAPIVSKAMKEDDLEHVEMIYKKASLNLSIVGLLLLALIMSNLDALLHLTNDYDSLAAGKMVVFWVGLTKLVDMATSVNSHIIGYSKYFRINFYIILLMAVLNIGLNFWLIPLYGITGAAFATFLSIATANTMRFIYVWFRWKIQPFSYKHLIAALLVLITFGVANLLPMANTHPILSIIIRSIVIVVVFIPTIWYLKLSEDINEMIQNIWNKISQYIKR
ncbi:MAG: polysaccharide biosynthesis C-terminal domain-containing protein [Chitinophagales bacterium]|nr:polysaccharide biosynthesis C-terminal domain-containing protein [Chitinophagales bacterium]